MVKSVGKRGILNSILKMVILVLLVNLILIEPGCRQRSGVSTGIAQNELPEKKYDEAAGVVEDYNKAIFSKDWKKVQQLLEGQALSSFNKNKGSYSSSGILLEQKVSVETWAEDFCIVRACTDMEIIRKNSQRVLSREWTRFYLLKSNGWKIIKLEPSDERYSSEVRVLESRDDKTTVEKIESYIKLCAEGKIEKASEYLSGKLLNMAEKYKLEAIPASKLKISEIKLLGNSDTEKYVYARYFINERELQTIFKLVKIKEIWLIDEQI